MTRINRKIMLFVGLLAVVGVLVTSNLLFATVPDYTTPHSPVSSINSPIEGDIIEELSINIAFTVPTEPTSTTTTWGDYSIYTLDSWIVSIVDEPTLTRSGTNKGDLTVYFDLPTVKDYTIELVVEGTESKKTWSEWESKFNYLYIPFTNKYYRSFSCQIVVVETTQAVTTTIIPEPITIITTITEGTETVISTIVTTVDHTVIETLMVTVTRTLTKESTPSFGLMIVLLSIISIRKWKKRDD